MLENIEMYGVDFSSCAIQLILHILFSSLFFRLNKIIYDYMQKVNGEL